MMSIILKMSCLLLVLSKNFVENNATDTVLTMVIGTSHGEVLLNSEQLSSNFPKGTLIVKFDQGIAALAKYKDYLFVSTETSIFGWQGYIYRFGFDWKNIKLNGSSYEVFHKVGPWNEWVTSMVVANEFLYAGRTVGVMLRCFTGIPRICEEFHSAGSAITGLDYDPFTKNIYGTTQKRTLWRCLHCDKDLFFENGGEFTAVKVAYGAVWIGSLGPAENRTVELLRCLLDNTNDKKKCHAFYDLGKVCPIDSMDTDASGMLFVSNGNQMWQFDPDLAFQEINRFIIPINSQTFIVAQKKLEKKI